MPKVLKLNAAISPSGEILLDKEAVKKYYTGLQGLSKDKLEAGKKVDIRVLFYPVKEEGDSSLNIDLPLTELQETEIELIAKKQRSDKDAVTKLVRSRGSIKSRRFRENVLRILNAAI